MSLICNISGITTCPSDSGIRTTVYFKGCGLKCVWCDRPETFSAEKNIAYLTEKCTLCGACVESCPENCFSIASDKLVFQRTDCKKCGKCVKICKAGALSQYGEQKSVEQIFEIIMKSHSTDVLLTGGECLFQSDFVVELLKKCRQAELKTAVETSFFVPFENIKTVLPFVNQLFVDLKHHNTEKHKEFTGQSNKLIIKNIRKVSKLHDNIIIKIPLIPGVNDSEKDMLKFGRIISTFKEGVKGVELVRYDHLAGKKYESIGMEYSFFANETQSDETLQKLADALNSIIKANAYFKPTSLN